MEEFIKESKNSFNVLLLGIIFDPLKGQILITRDLKNNEKNLRWNFPDSKIDPSQKLEDSLKKGIKNKIGYDVEILGPVYSSVNGSIILIHYLCEVVGGQKTNDNSTELKWVRADKLKKYLTIQVEPALEEYITNLI